jgi:hypothetical protein
MSAQNLPAVPAISPVKMIATLGGVWFRARSS